MAGELLAQVLLDIGNQYAARKAEERALARQEAEKLDQRAYAKVLREEQMAAQKEMLDYSKSKEVEMWKERTKVELENAREQAKVLDRDQKIRRAVETGAFDEATAAKATDKQLLDAIEKAQAEKLVRDTDLQDRVMRTKSLPENASIYSMGRSAVTNLEKELNALSAVDKTGFVAKTYKSLVEAAMEERFGKPGPARDKALADLGGMIPPDISKQVAAQLQAVLANNPEMKASAARAEFALRQANEAYAAAMQRGIDLNAPAEKQAWWTRADTKGVNVPTFETPTAPVVTPTPVDDGKINLPGQGDTPATPATPTIDPSNPFFQQVQREKQGKLYEQFVPAYQAGRQSDEELQRIAASKNGFFSGGPETAASEYERLRATRAERARQAATLAQQLDGYTPGRVPFFAAAKDALHIQRDPRIGKTPEDQIAWLNNARSWPVKP